MEKDCHYYVIYFLCLAAGFDPDTAYVASYSSQYVDDSTDGRKKTLVDENSREVGKFDPIRTSHNGFESIGADVQEKIYYPFHFLPGLKGDSFDQKMVTKNGGEGDLFPDLITEALASKNPYRFGITLHVLADTYSHTDFSGLWTWGNDVNRVNYIPARRGWLLNLVNKWKWLTVRKWLEAAPAIGHSQAYTFPDFPYLNWKYFDYQGEMHSVSNSFKFRDGLEDLYELLVLNYAQAQKLQPRIDTDILLQKLWDGIRTPGSLEKRCKYWQRVIETFAAEKKLNIPGRHLKYRDTDWESDVLKRLKKFFFFPSLKMKLKVSKQDFVKSHFYNFHEAAREHRLFVMQKINDYLAKGHSKKAQGVKISPKGMAISLEFINATKAKKILE
ncbi:MAG: hypothetical protein NT166_04290 [Candidatus Aminicenantes bacterium]|nr:hypothetical protein [Candidatus Aminicenantes bacterium]